MVAETLPFFLLTNFCHFCGRERKSLPLFWFIIVFWGFVLYHADSEVLTYVLQYSFRKQWLFPVIVSHILGWCTAVPHCKRLSCLHVCAEKEPKCLGRMSAAMWFLWKMLYVNCLTADTSSPDLSPSLICLENVNGLLCRNLKLLMDVKSERKKSWLFNETDTVKLVSYSWTNFFTCWFNVLYI